MTRLGLALALLLGTLILTSQLGGWEAQWHASRARQARDVARALRHRSAAIDENPLSRKSRLAFAEVVGRAVAELGAERTAAFAPRATVGRAAMADVLDERQAASTAAAVRAGILATTPEEIDLLASRSLRQLGLDAAGAGHCPQALPLFEAAMARGSGDERLRLKYASCLIEIGNGATAVAVLVPAYERNPSSRWSRLFLAEAEAKLGRVGEAEKLILSLLVSDPDFYDVWRFAGQLYAATDRPKEAIYCYYRAQLLRPQTKWLQWEIWKQQKIRRNKEAARGTPSPSPGT